MAAPDARDLARVLLGKAASDEAAARLFAAEAEIADEVIGMHAQQAVEKSLKAVLAVNGVAYRFTHDIAYLAELLDEAGVSMPEDLTEAEQLTPWASGLRYEEPLQPEQIDRALAASLATKAISWASSILDEPQL